MTRAARRDAVVVVTLAAAFYAAFSSSAPRWGDAADIARRAVTEPLAPYGRSYPLQSLLVRTVDVVFGDAARSSTFVTAACAALGVGLLHHICRRGLGVGRVAAAGAAGAWAVGHTYWSSAVDGEAYVLLGVFALAACGAVLASREGLGGAWAAGLLVGLMPLHHRAALFLAPVVLLAPVCVAPAALRLRAGCRVLAGVAVGSVPFVVLVLVEAARLPGGLGADFLLGVLVGAPRNAELLLDSGRDLGASLAYVGRWFVFTFPGPALPVAAWGLWRLVRRTPATGISLLLLGASALALPLRFDVVGDRYVFLVAAYPVVACGLAVGLHELVAQARVLGRSVAALCVVMPPLVYFGLAWSPRSHALLPELSAAAARDFFLPVRAGDDGSLPFVATVAETLATTSPLATDEPIYAEWGAAAALEYGRDVAGVLPGVTVLRRMPTADEIDASGERGVLVALTPIWAVESSRLPVTTGGAHRVASSLYRLRSTD